MRKATEDKLAVAIELLGLGLTLGEIGSALGCSRQYVNQLLGRAGIHTREVRAEQKLLEAEKVTFPIKGFRMAMHRWLHHYGIFRCCHCGWQDREAFGPKVGNICRECNRKRAAERYHTSEKHQKYIKAYRRSERGKKVMKEAQVRWVKKLKQTPEGAEKIKQKNMEGWRKFYRKKLATEEGREYLRRMSMLNYALRVYGGDEEEKAE